MCEICSTESLKNSYVFVGVMGIIGLFILFSIIKYILHVSGQKEQDGKIILSALDDFNSRALSMLEKSVKRVSIKSDSNEDTKTDDEEEEEATKKMLRNQMIMVKIKIAFVFFQVILLFQEVYVINYPPPYVDYLAFFSVLRLDLFSVAKMECAVAGSFLNQLLFTTVTPIFITLMIALFWVLSVNKFGRETRQFKIIENTLINLFIIMTYILFPGLCASVFSSFVCEEFDDGSSYLRADYSVDCDSSEYSSIFIVASIMVLMYPIGIPSMYLVMLWRNREKLDPQKFFTEMSLLEAVFHRKREVNYLKFLFDAYLPQYWWTEVMECVRKLLLTGFVVFFYEGSSLQVVFGLFFSIIFLALYAHINPYLMPSNNTFAAFVHFQISFTLMCTLLIRTNDLISTSAEKESFNITRSQLSMALLVSNASVLAIGVILILRSFFMVSERDFASLGYDSKAKKVSRASKENDDLVFHDVFDSDEKSRPLSSNPMNIESQSKSGVELPTITPIQRPKSSSMQKMQSDSFKRSKSPRLGAGGGPKLAKTRKKAVRKKKLKSSNDIDI